MRLGETRVDDGDRPALGRQLIRDLEAAHDDRPEADDQDVRPVAQHLRLADRDGRGLDVGQVEPRIARVVQRERMLLLERGVHQPAQLLLVLGRGDDQVGQLALRGQREHALVAGAVLADKPRPVDADDHRLIVLADVVHELVEGALQEGRVDRHERPAAADRQSGGKRDGVLFGDAHVVHPVGERGLELGQPGAGGHARRDGDDARIGIEPARSVRAT